MNAEQLSKVGSDLVRRCGTRDPFQIAKELGIIVLDDCENFGQLKGMYRVVKKNRFIFLNQDLSPQTKRIVCAHEIGHDRLHRALAKGDGLQEFVLYKMNSIPLLRLRYYLIPTRCLSTFTIMGTLRRRLHRQCTQTST